MGFAKIMLKIKNNLVMIQKVLKSCVRIPYLIDALVSYSHLSATKFYHTKNE